MDESHKHYAKWKKPEQQQEKATYCDSITMTFWNSGMPEGGGMELIKRGHKHTFRSNENIW